MPRLVQYSFRFKVIILSEFFKYLNNDLTKLIHLINTLINHFLLVKSWDFNWVELLLAKYFWAFLKVEERINAKPTLGFYIYIYIIMILKLTFYTIFPPIGGLNPFINF